MLKLKILTLLLLSLQTFAFSQWQEKNIATNFTLTSVDFTSNNIGFVTGGNEIYKTDNGAENWMLSHAAGGSVFYEDLFAIDKKNIIAVGKDFASGQSIITKTIDGGENWTAISMANSSFLRSVFFISEKIGFCSGGVGVILKTTDAGENWEALDSGVDKDLLSIYFVNEMVGFAVGGGPSNGMILKTIDGGLTWNQKNTPSGNFHQSVFFTDQETGYIAGWNGEIIKTSDCGDTWVNQNSIEMIGNLEVVFTDLETGFIVGGIAGESLIQKTINGGDLWEDISPSVSASLICIQFPSFDLGYAVGANGTVVKTETGGITSTSNLGPKEEFKVYPNPAIGKLYVQSQNGQTIEKLRVFDGNGRLLKELMVNTIQDEIDFSDLDANVYYLEIQSESIKRIRKIIKK